jgi:hypothetical protein
MPRIPETAIRIRYARDPEGAKEEIRRLIDRNRGVIRRVFYQLCISRRMGNYLLDMMEMRGYVDEVRKERMRLWREGPEWMQRAQEELRR